MRRAILALLLCLAPCCSAPGGRDAGPDGGADGDADGDADADVDAASDAGPDGDGSPEPDGDPDPEVPEDVAIFLASLGGVTAVEVASAPSGYRRFELTVTQPVDHDAPGGPSFEQHLTLLHRRAGAPFVLVTTGYDNYVGARRVELTDLLEANQLAVEHRYFGESRPSPVDWSFLDIGQSAADSHRVVELLRPYYSGPWIGTGASKGGMTAVYHRRFHSDDVAGTVAYVAPLSLGAPDHRYVDFVDAVGEASCREALAAVQVEALRRRSAMVELLGAYEGSSFDRIGGRGAALDAVVVSAAFTFWQYRGLWSCGSVPSAAASDEELFSFLDFAVGFDEASDAVFDYFEAYYYQARTELGYPELRTDHLAGLLGGEVTTLEAGLLPEGATAVFDPTVMEDVGDWVRDEGERLMFVYGENDPWSAGAFEPGDGSGSFLFVAPGANHGAQISDLTAADRETALEALVAWTGVTPRYHEPPPRLPLPREPGRFRRGL